MQYKLCRNYIYNYFYFQKELFWLILLLQYFQYIYQLTYQLVFFCIYSFYSLDIHQYRNFIAFTLTIAWIPNKSFIAYTFISQFFIFTSAFFLFHRCLLLQIIPSNLHIHLHVSCHFINLVSLVLFIYNVLFFFIKYL